MTTVETENTKTFVFTFCVGGQRLDLPCGEELAQRFLDEKISPEDMLLEVIKPLPKISLMKRDDGKVGE